MQRPWLFLPFAPDCVCVCGGAGLWMSLSITGSVWVSHVYLMRFLGPCVSSVCSWVCACGFYVRAGPVGLWLSASLFPVCLRVVCLHVSVCVCVWVSVRVLPHHARCRSLPPPSRSPARSPRTSPRSE